MRRVFAVVTALLLLLNLISPVLDVAQPAWPGRVVPAGAGPLTSPEPDLPPFREGLVDPPRSLNPLLPGGDNAVTRLLFRGLARLAPAGTVVPDLAQGWRQQGGTEWIVRLQPDLRWHDGTRVSARDVVFTLTAAAHPFLQGDPATRPRNLVWAGRRVEALDDQTVRLTLDQPDGSVPYDLTLPLLPAHLLDANPSRWAASPFETAPVGTGPFRWSSADAGAITLEAFRQADRTPQLGGYQFLLFASAEEAWAALVKGTIDGIASSFPPNLDSSGEPRLAGGGGPLYSWPTSDVLLLLWSPSSGADLLRALAPSLASSTLWPPYPSASTAAPVSPDGAAREGQTLTAQIYYGDGLAGEALETRRREAEVLARRLDALGVQVQLLQGSAAAPQASASAAAPTPPSAPGQLIGRLVLWRGGGDPDLVNLVRALPGPALELLRLAELARREPDEAQRRTLLASLALRLTSDGLVVPLARGTGCFIARHPVKGFEPNPFDRYAQVHEWRPSR